MIKLGKTKIKMSRLGQGTGVHGGNRQSDQTRMGFAKLVELMHHAYDRGIRFFDLADLVWHARVLPRSAQENGAQQARDPHEIVVAIRRAGRSNQRCPSGGRWRGRRSSDSATSLTTDYLDIVLLHCLTKPGWDRADGTVHGGAQRSERAKAGSTRSAARATICSAMQTAASRRRGSM